MIDHLKGKLDRVTPTYAVVDCQGVGYLAHISLNTYTRIKDTTQVHLFIHPVIREDAHLLYGFADEHEREVFRMLISVSGVGSATARMILSSLSAQDTEMAILSGDVGALKRIKGIGAKSAERIIIDLKDKVGKGAIHDFLLPIGNQATEAAMALQALGFNRAAIDKALQKAKENQQGEVQVEEMIKQALKFL
ncbi:MAG: Holliday junction branch migration protein RuvA [Candidatus Competibacteraceae bacterium]|nr:Holliday junction branch migration protein RuvA [Candidatus Competibacteraceae bacterium]